jgi:hypothetical protein
LEGAVREFAAGYLVGSLIVAAWDRREAIRARVTAVIIGRLLA